MTNESNAADAPHAPAGPSTIGFALAGAVAFVHFVSLRGIGPVDDEYIVWQYARTILDGGGYAYFPGAEVSDGVTSPLWLLACMAALAVGGSPEAFTPLIGGASFVLLAACVGAFGQRFVPRRFALLPGLLIAANPAVAWHAHAGLGTLPAALAIGLAVIATARADGRGGALAGLGLAVAAALRPETAPVALAVAWAMPGGTLGRRALVVAPTVALMVGVALWRAATFGSAVPATAALKALPLAEELRYGLHYAIDSFTWGGLPALLLAASAAFFRTPAGSAGRLAGAAALAGFATVTAVGGDWMLYGRLYVPHVAAAALGASALVLSAPASWLRGVGSIGLLAATLAGFTHLEEARVRRHFEEHWWLEIGDALRERTPPDASVATSPIGAIAWRSERRVVDVLGLTHDAFLGLEPALDVSTVKGHHRFDGGWVLDQEPDYIILGNGRFGPSGAVDVNPWEEGITVDPRFGRDYVREWTFVDVVGQEPRPFPYARRGRARSL